MKIDMILSIIFALTAVDIPSNIKYFFSSVSKFLSCNEKKIELKKG